MRTMAQGAHDDILIATPRGSSLSIPRSRCVSPSSKGDPRFGGVLLTHQRHGLRCPRRKHPDTKYSKRITQSGDLIVEEDVRNCFPRESCARASDRQEYDTIALAVFFCPPSLPLRRSHPNALDCLVELVDGFAAGHPAARSTGPGDLGSGGIRGERWSVQAGASAVQPARVAFRKGLLEVGQGLTLVFVHGGFLFQPNLETDHEVVICLDSLAQDNLEWSTAAREVAQEPLTLILGEECRLARDANYQSSASVLLYSSTDFCFLFFLFFLSRRLPPEAESLFGGMKRKYSKRVASATHEHMLSGKGDKQHAWPPEPTTRLSRLESFVRQSPRAMGCPLAETTGSVVNTTRAGLQARLVEY